jgi:RNA polymerase sigma-70 factor (ECF subfamily)
VSKNPAPRAPYPVAARAPELDQALEHIYERYAPDVERWVQRLVGPGGDVEDLIHDVFVVALRRRAEFRGEASPRTWLFRITHHVVRSRRRRDLVRRLLLVRHGPALQSPPAPGTALEHIERREQCVQLYAALDRLPEDYRTALILYELEGLSGAEVAELVGVDVGTLWVRLHRGRARLLALIGRTEEGPR